MIDLVRNERSAHILMKWEAEGGNEIMLKTLRSVCARKKQHKGWSPRVFCLRFATKTNLFSLSIVQHHARWRCYIALDSCVL